MINARDGGINGVKITFEECETGYATDKGVECYERLKGTARRDAVRPAVDRHHLRADRQGARPTRSRCITVGYGLSASQDGNVVQVELPADGQLLDRAPTS